MMSKAGFVGILLVLFLMVVTLAWVCVGEAKSSKGDMVLNFPDKVVKRCYWSNHRVTIIFDE
jgi:hypothetical protein